MPKKILTQSQGAGKKKNIRCCELQKESIDSKAFKELFKKNYKRYG
jgi:hypothetical protein